MKRYSAASPRRRIVEAVRNCDHAVPIAWSAGMTLLKTGRGFGEALFVVLLIEDCETV